MPFALIYQNFADNAVLGGTAFLSSLPATNMQDPDIGVVARTTAVTETTITVDLGNSRPVGGVVLGPINIGPGGQWRIRSYADVALSDLQYDSGLKTRSGTLMDWADVPHWLEWEDDNFWDGVLSDDLSELPFFIVEAIAAASASAATAQFWKIDLIDPSNAQGYFNVGRLLMGRIYRPSLNFAPDNNDFAVQWLSDVGETLGGFRAWWVRAMRRTWRMAWPSLPEDEAWSDWFQIAIKSRIDQHVFVIPDEADDEALMRKRAILATLKQSPSIALANVSRAALALDAEEVI